MKNWKSTETMKKTKSSFHEKIDKIDKLLTMFTKTKLNNTKTKQNKTKTNRGKKAERIEITNIRNERKDIITDPMDV